MIIFYNTFRHHNQNPGPDDDKWWGGNSNTGSWAGFMLKVPLPRNFHWEQVISGFSGHWLCVYYNSTPAIWHAHCAPGGVTALHSLRNQNLPTITAPNQQGFLQLALTRERVLRCKLCPEKGTKRCWKSTEKGAKEVLLKSLY